jgi:mono/diheme cytochrome c family protein
MKWLLLICVISVLSACSQSPKGNASSQTGVADTADGALLFKKYCAACHQMNGNGIPGAFPQLRQNDIFKTDNAKVIEVVLKGMSGEVTINNVKYNGIMVGFPNLTDKEIAGVINYIKKDLNQTEGFVTEADVKQVRLK